MSAVAIIPARGGSKRIPGKNIKTFLGKPIITYAISAAIESKLFDEVVVSTDDMGIADIARSAGASVPFMRSSKNSGDFASTFDVLEEVLGEMSAKKKYEFGLCLYPTAPFVTAGQLKKAYSLLVEKKYDSVFPVVRFGFPIQRALVMQNDRVKMISPEHMFTRSQDLEPTYHDAGQWYWFHVGRLLANHRLWTDNSFGLEVSELDAQDIDNEVDWQLAELKFRIRKNLKD